MHSSYLLQLFLHYKVRFIATMEITAINPAALRLRARLLVIYLAVQLVKFQTLLRKLL